MLFKRRVQGGNVTVGAVFHRIHRNNVWEQAEVLSVVNDGAGIPHVRFYRQFPDTMGGTGREVRVLSLTSFEQLYQPAPHDYKIYHG